jgi:predicted amidohydrolase YtcJ
MTQALRRSCKHRRASLTAIWVTFLLATLSACSPAEQSAQNAAESTQSKVDVIFTNGQILTLDETATIASTLVVSGERIVAVGDAALANQFSAPQVIDLQGRTLMPGFVDSHTHIYGRPPHYIDLTEVSSVAEIVSLVRAKAAEVGDGNWVTGYGWSEDELAEGRRPLIGDLDAAAPGHPVMLTRAGGHSAVFSSRALEIGGVDATTPNPDGGIIERDDNGALNGVIRERQNIIGELIPVTPPMELRPSLIENLQALFAKGITSIIHANATLESYPVWEAAYAEHRGNLPRASVQLLHAGPEAMAAFGKMTGAGDEHLQVGPLKIFADGGFTGPAAYTSKPYKGEDEYRGKLNMTEAELKDLIIMAHEEGWQLGIHAIGDAAIMLTVDYLMEALARSPREDHRHYLNHFTVMPDAQTMDDMAAHGIAITQQPNFTYTLEGRYVANLDGSRLQTNNPLRTPMKHGIHLAISSDILPIGPWVGIYAAVTRKGMSGRVFGPEEAISRVEALKGYTSKGAWLTREEDIKGTLAPGMLADLIILSADPLAIPDVALLDLEVMETWLGGQRVYQKQ